MNAVQPRPSPASLTLLPLRNSLLSRASQITFQECVLLKRCNAVILASVYKDLVEPTMTCPITGAKLKEKDVVRLAKAGSSFAAAGKHTAKKYTNTIT